MATLAPTRTALRRHTLRPLLARPTRRTNAVLQRLPTSLQEKDDVLNESVSDADIDKAKPRWSYTPPALKATYNFQLKEAKNPENSNWTVNEDPAKLDSFYERFLGRNGARALPEELRWLAVTHKSFDYGRRGYNTKLSFFGRQVIVLETMNAIMTQTPPAEPFLNDPWMRKHFMSPALTNVDKLSNHRPADFMTMQTLAQVGFRTGLNEVVRWKPKNTANLAKSGIDMVLATTIFAIVGAVSLQQGGEAASRVARENVLGRMRSDATR